MNILITGVNGFIGKHLAIRLHQLGHRVIGVGRKQPDKPLNDLLSGFQKADFSQADFDLELSNIDAVIHLAALVHPQRNASNTSSLETYRRVNTKSTQRLASMAEERGINKFVFLSSILVHGLDSGHGAFTENSPIAPPDDYSISKAEAENLIRESDFQQMKYTIVRPAVVYGPGAPAHFGLLARLVKTHLPLPLLGLKNKLSCVYVENLCDFIILTLNSSHTDNETYLIADEEALSIPEITRCLMDGLKIHTPMIHLPSWVLKAGAYAINKKRLYKRVAVNHEIDIKKAKTETGWNPPFNAQLGLKKAAEQDFRFNYSLALKESGRPSQLT